MAGHSFRRPHLSELEGRLYFLGNVSWNPLGPDVFLGSQKFDCSVFAGGLILSHVNSVSYTHLTLPTKA